MPHRSVSRRALFGAAAASFAAGPAAAAIVPDHAGMIQVWVREDDWRRLQQLAAILGRTGQTRPSDSAG